MLLAAAADWVGRRRVLILTPLLITLAGAVLALARRPWLLMLGAVAGTPFRSSPTRVAIGGGCGVQLFGAPALIHCRISSMSPAASGPPARGIWLRAIPGAPVIFWNR